MGLIHIQNGQAVPTVEEKQSAKRALIISQINSSFNQLILDFKKIFGEVWYSSDLSPQEVMDAFGPDAAQLFLIAGKITDALNAISPGVVDATAPKTYTINQDGTVTVHDA